MSSCIALWTWSLVTCKSDLSSIDFAFNRFFMKLFRTNNIKTVTVCQSFFGISLPSFVLRSRTDKFEQKFSLCADLVKALVWAAVILPCCLWLFDFLFMFYVWRIKLNIMHCDQRNQIFVAIGPCSLAVRALPLFLDELRAWARMECRASVYWRRVVPGCRQVGHEWILWTTHSGQGDSIIRCRQTTRALHSTCPDTREQGTRGRWRHARQPPARAIAASHDRWRRPTTDPARLLTTHCMHCK